LRLFLKFVDKTSEMAGKLFAWLIVFLVVGLMYEVIARYAFNAPTIWSYDITYMIYVLFFPVMAVLLYKGIPYVAHSWFLKETSTAGAWSPPLYPLKTVMPIAIFLLMLQGIAEFIRNLGLAIRGKEYGV